MEGTRLIMKKHGAERTHGVLGIGVGAALLIGGLALTQVRATLSPGSLAKVKADLATFRVEQESQREEQVKAAELAQTLREALENKNSVETPVEPVVLVPEGVVAGAQDTAVEPANPPSPTLDPVTP